MTGYSPMTPIQAIIKVLIGFEITMGITQGDNNPFSLT